MVEAASPPKWQIETEREARQRRIVCFGRHHIAVADITGMSLEEVRKRNVAGLLIGAAAFLLAATVIAHAVLEDGAMARYLIASVFLAVLGISGLGEARGVRRLSHYELALHLKSGDRVVFTSADRADIQTLALHLAAERG